MRCGVDIIKVSRMEESLRNPRFLNRIFSDDEIALFASKGNRIETVAGNFAAKEAFLKCMGTGLGGADFKDIATLRDEHGKPYLELAGKAAGWLGGRSCDVSISHDGEYATAMIVVSD